MSKKLLTDTPDALPDLEQKVVHNETDRLY
jgi:hypothetical protein